MMNGLEMGEARWSLALQAHRGLYPCLHQDSVADFLLFQKRSLVWFPQAETSIMEWIHDNLMKNNLFKSLIVNYLSVRFCLIQELLTHL